MNASDNSESLVVLRVSKDWDIGEKLRSITLLTATDSDMKAVFRYADGITVEFHCTLTGARFAQKNGSARRWPKTKRTLWQRMAQRLNYFWRRING